MQDAFLALWERWDRVGAMEDPTGYLYRTSMNVFRKRGRRAALVARRHFARAPDPVPFADIDAQQDVVADASGSCRHASVPPSCCSTSWTTRARRPRRRSA